MVFFRVSTGFPEEILTPFYKFPVITPSSQAEMSMTKWLLDAHDVVHSWMTDHVNQAPRWLVYSALTAGVGMVATAGYFYRHPATFLRLLTDMARWRGGCVEKWACGKKFTYCYMERGTPSPDKPSIIFINGYGGSKDDWLEYIAILPKDLHLVLMDLPGQGKSSTPTEEEDASLYKLTDSLHEFVLLTGLDKKPFHLLGISMGGGVSGLYAATYPQHVDRLTLTCPVLQCPIETELWQDWNPDIDESEDPVEVRRVFYLCAYNKENIWQALWIYRAIVEMNKPKRKFNTMLSSKMREEVAVKEKYEGTLAKITCPVQILWGEEDQILHVSGASLLEDVIPTVKRTDILPKCGHIVFWEQKEVTKSLLLDFSNTTYST